MIQDKPKKKIAQRVDGKNERAWRESVIRRTAYYLFEGRGRAPGYELEDWLAAEVQVNNQLKITT